MDPIGAVRQLWNRFSAWLHLRRGIRLYRRGRFARAAAHIHAALLRAGPSFTAHLVLGKIYLRLNRFDRARQEFAQARFLDPGRFSAQGLPEDLLLEMAERFYQPLWQDGRGPGAPESVPPAHRRRSEERRVGQ
ncbi:MAG: tetratricopeptide repeat protein, partial [Planctomycetota bacterium JB042]